MNRRGFTLVEIMIVVAIIALLAAIAIPNLLRARQTSAEAAAQATLKSLATAEEVFAAANNGNYVNQATVANDTGHLTGATPPYISVEYPGTTNQSYGYSCAINAGDYVINAMQSGLSTSARNYQVTTGAALTSF